MSQHKYRYLNGLLTLICIFTIAVSATTQTAYAQDDNDQPTPETPTGGGEGGTGGATGTNTTSTSTGNQAPAAPTRPSNRTLLVNAFRLPVCEEVITNQPIIPGSNVPIVPTFQTGQRVQYSWNLKPSDAVRDEVYLFDLTQSQFDLLLFQLSSNNSIFDFGWARNLRIVRGTEGATPRSGQAQISPFDLNNRPSSFNWFVVFRDASGNPICRTSNNNWIRTNFDAAGTPQLCGSSDLGRILQPCTGQGTQVAQGTGTGTTGSGSGGGGGGGGPTDSDGDGVPDGTDACPAVPGVPPTGCPAVDTDGDGVVDGIDLCPGTPAATPVNGVGCPDTDGDTVFDNVDACPAVPGVPPTGCPAVDTDGDGVVDGIDLCPGTPAATPVNGVGCPDTDGDTVFDNVDACPAVAGIPPTGCPAGDADGDGVPDGTDVCPATPPATPVNGVGCPDTDGDGVFDNTDACPGTPAATPVDAVGCPLPVDTDADGVQDGADNCPTVPNGPLLGPNNQLDTDNDGLGDVCDTLPFGCILDPHIVRMDGSAVPPFEEDYVGDNFFVANQQCPDRPNDILGNGNSNIIEGTVHNDVIDGAGGIDVISGRGGADTLTGGAGNDVIRGGDNTSDTSPGDTFDESAFGGDMTITLNATTGPSGYTGTAIGNGNDALFGIENVFSGGGNDSFLIRAPINNLIDGNGGTDTATIERMTGSGTITIRRGANGTGPNVTVSGTGIGTDSLNNIEQVDVTGNSTAVNYFDIRDNEVNSLTGGSNLDTYDVTTTSAIDMTVNQTGANDFTVDNGTAIDTLTGFEQVFTGNGNGDDTFNITQPNTGVNVYDARGNTNPAVAGQGDLYNNNTGSDLTFTIDATGSGVVNDGGANDTIRNFEHFTSGGGNDRYNIADNRTNRLDAGAGQDTYDVVSTGNLSVVQNGGANDVLVSGSGGFGTDTLTGFEEVYTDTGNDTFTISFGNTGFNTYDAGGNGTAGDLYDNTSGNNIDVLIGAGGSGTIDDGAQDRVLNFEHFATAGGDDSFVINDNRGNSLNAGAGADTYDVSSFVGTSTIQVTGTAGVITASGTPIGTDTLTGFETIATGNGNDTFLFDGITTDNVTFDGGGGTADLYRYNGPTGDLTVTHNTQTPTTSTGSVTDGVNTDNFIDIENITTGAGNDLFIINGVGAGQTNVFNAGGNGTAGDTYNNITGDNLSVVLLDGTGTAGGAITGTDSIIDFENLVLGIGNDTVTITTPTEAFGIIDVGGGNDIVNLTDSGNNSIQGGIGTDTLNLVYEAPGAATINASGLATLGVNPNETTGAPLGNDSIFNFEQLNVTGTSGNDSLTIIDVDNNFIDMLGGTDLVVEGLEDSGGDDTVTVTRSGNNVVVAGVATGTDTINNTERVDLIGSTQSNTFVMNDASANSIDGATNDATGDTYDAGAATTAITANLNGANTGTVSSTFTGTDTIVNIENLVTGSGSDTVNVNDAGNNSVVTGTGSDIANVTMVDSGGADTITINRTGGGFQGADVSLVDGGAPNDSTGDDTFVNTERVNMTGTANNDTFIVNDNLTNILAGGAGSDVYDVSGSTTMDLTVEYNIAGNATISRTVPAADFANDSLTAIENIFTGSGDDIFIVEGIGNSTFDANGNGATGDLFNYTGAGNMTLNYTGASGTASTSGAGVATLQNFEDFAGDAGQDSFVMGDTNGRTLSGEEDIDTYNYNGVGNLTVEVGNAAVDNISVDDGGGADTLLGFENFQFSNTGSVTFDIYLERISSKVGAPIRLDASMATNGGIFNFIGSALDIDRDAGANDPDDFRDIEIIVGAAMDSLNFTAVTSAGINVLDLSNTASFQTIFGLGSNVRIKLTGAVDSVTGTAMNDNITGNSGANTIDGAGGNDRLSGGGGDDSLVGGTGTDTLTGGAGNDTIIGGGEAGDLLEEGTNTGNLTIDLDTVAGSMQDGTYTDVLQGINNVNTGSGNDSVTGNTNNNVINTGNGNDTVLALNGNDSISTGQGADSVDGGDGNDTMLLGDGNDTAIGGNDNDNIQGEGGDDSLDGEAGNDTVLGGTGADTVYGGVGNDRVDGQEGADLVYGGSNNAGADGSDTITDTGTDGGDTIFGGNAGGGDDLGDRITLGASTDGRTVYGGNDNTLGNGNDGSDTITVDGSSNNNIYGGNANSGGDGDDLGDKIDVTNGTNNTIYGGNNNTGGNGDDNGTDSIYNDTDFTAIYGGNANDGGNGNDGANSIVNAGDNATIYGGNQNQGGIGNDAGTDTLIVLSNNTSVFGGNQNVSGEGSDASDVINDYSGSDTSGGNNTFYGGNSNSNNNCAGGGLDCADGSDTMEIYSSNNLVYGGNLNTSGGDGNDQSDTVTLNAGNNTLYGGNNNNSNGSTGNDIGDTLNISAGATTPNTVYGGNRNNSTACTGILCDDIGSDTITDESSGSDAIYGGNNNTAGNGDDGSDVINLSSPGSGTGDTVYGGNNNGGTGNGADLGDTISDFSGRDDTIYGGNRNASSTCTGLVCQDGGDTITLVDSGANSVVGGNNNVSGTAGNDTGGNVITDLSMTGIDTIYVGNSNTGASTGDLAGNNTVSTDDGGTDTICAGNKGNGTATGTTTVNNAAVGNATVVAPPPCP